MSLVYDKSTVFFHLIIRNSIALGNELIPKLQRPRTKKREEGKIKRKGIGDIKNIEREKEVRRELRNR